MRKISWLVIACRWVVYCERVEANLEADIGNVIYEYCAPLATLATHRTIMICDKTLLFEVVPMPASMIFVRISLVIIGQMYR